MNEEQLARVLRRDPNINVPRPQYRRPERTQPLRWARSTPHTLKQRILPLYRTIRTTEPLKWIPDEHLKTAWPFLPNRPPVYPELPVKKHGREELEIEEARKRQKAERRRAKAEAAIAKLTAPPALKPDIFPLSPQAARAPRPKDPSTEEIRKKWPGPGDFEFNWKDNPHKDHSMAVRDSIPNDMYEPPIVRAMPNRKPLNNSTIKLPFVEDATVFYPSKIPGSGDCFFGAVSMALYGTTMYWHYTKYCHLWFFRYVLTHPAHPRHSFYWHINSIGDANGQMNTWHRLSTPHAWQLSALFNVTADTYNLFVVLYEAPQAIDLFGQYNATHVFFHLINRNHYESLIPKDNEVLFPFPDGIKINPRPGRAKIRPPSGHGKNIVPPPIALPIIPRPSLMDMTRVLGINTKGGALDMDVVRTGLKRERALARKLNDPGEIKWWLAAEAKERKAEEDEWLAIIGKVPSSNQGKLPTNEELAANLSKTLGKGKKPGPGEVQKEPEGDKFTPGGTKKKKFTGFGLDSDDSTDDETENPTGG
ncbi:hypothetical protein BcDW1_6934 [Botrytis cinerea BcDW1]|uniref:OTU domain-containing protein n=1 Tax=Botryotinia fuckeliana (strain BcDW1) TaxID=1290391 RepID=M7TTA5_BOTF1|nr:hypothetical protein BcDW1_6934 [Botrytis cinerea BcDW1]